jgi:colanic acid/amylovoran biosynthesis glycosyltransferase
MNSLLVTPENWFDLPHTAASTSDASLELAMTTADGRCPFAEVSLDELRAVHETFRAWRPALAADSRVRGLKAGEYDRFLLESRDLLKRSAQNVLEAADQDGERLTQRHLLFPDPGHHLMADSGTAIEFLRRFLVLSHSQSLVRWAHGIAIAEDSDAICRGKTWARLLLQKLAVEDELPEALTRLRSVYAEEPIRRELVACEAQLLAKYGLMGLDAWARALGVDRPARVQAAFTIPPRSAAAPGTGAPDVTVLVPSYCHENFIEAALESVLSQTYPRFLLRVVDDRSSDRTVERAARIDDPRLRVEVNDTNLGLGNSLLRALESVDTPYVALLNSDDLFHPDRLERCRDVLERSPRMQVAATNFAVVDEEGRRLTVDNVSRLLDGPQIADWVQWFSDVGHVSEGTDLVAELLERNFLITSSNVVARTEFVRGCRESLRSLKYCLDWQLFLEAAARQVLVHVPEELLAYRLHQSNTVWFAGDRRISYVLEVNRVLAHTFQQMRTLWPERMEAADLEQILKRLASHAAKHSEASGSALYAVELLGAEPLDQALERSDAVRQHIRSISGSNGASDAGAQLNAKKTRPETVLAAARILAEVSQEEVVSAVASERFAREEVHQYSHDLRLAQLEQDRLEQRLSEQTGALEASRGQLKAQIAQIQAQAEQLAHVRSSPEWTIGDRLWNSGGLSRVGRPAVRAARTLRDRRNRWGLAAGRVRKQLGLARPRAVVAACWNFPIHSQTFVYQEIQSLSWAGLDTLVFCGATNPRTELPPAFESLWDKRIVLESDWTFNKADLDYFRRTRPKRVDELLTRLAAATGRSPEALLQESIVMMGFTFARHVELSGAEYLHTYFFYDQSFLALMAAYLLEIPRGVTAYADHMLSDYAFKCVPLHLELADIVVATSQRIKSELSAIGGGRFDDKIIVKPNGIDTSRFPYVDAENRLKNGGTPELIAINRIEPKKGLIYLVEALDILKTRGVDVRLNIVGGADANTPASAECFREVKARIGELGLSDRVVMHGVKQQHEFLPLLAQSRIFIAPYVEVASGDKDGIPTAILEGMSAGLPIVGTDAGSILEVITDSVEGLCVPQRNPASLADAIERLLSDRTLYARMSGAARQRAVSEFDAHVTEKLLHERIKACQRRATRS